MKRRLRNVLLLSFVPMFLWTLSPAIAQQGGGKPTLAQLQKLFPGSKLTEADMSRFSSKQVDLNGDGKKEYVIVENPNGKKAAPKAVAKKCLCPASKPNKKEKRLGRYMKSYKKALYKLELFKVKRRRYQLKVWFSLRKAKGKTFSDWSRPACVTLGRKYRWLRRYRVRDVLFINTDDGQTAKIRASRCRSLSRTRKKRRAKRFKKWSKEQDNSTPPMCACPKKKKKKKGLPPPTRALNIVVAYETKPAALTQPSGTPAKGAKPAAVSADALLPQLKLIGRLQGNSLRLVSLNSTNKMYGLRIEQSTQAGFRGPRTSVERIYIYDEGNTGRLKQVFQIKTAREGDDREPGAKQIVDVKFRQMDSDAWYEIVADAYYETPRFNGLIARRMFKWYEGRYVPLNSYRGILRARSSSTWKKIAPRGSRMLQKRLLMRTSPSNVIDGFKNTPWIASKRKRSINEWVRVDMMRNVQLLGVAVSVKAPTRLFSYVVPRLFTSRAPKFVGPQYLMIKTSSGFKQTAAVRPGGGFTFVRFPTTVQTRYVHVAISGEHKIGKRTVRVKLPSKENAIGGIAEIIPITNQVRYSASSFELKGTQTMTPRMVGDRRTATAWAEGRSDQGLGEWIQMVFPMPRILNSITVVNGCHRPGERYILNNRIKDATLTFSDGSRVNVSLKDNHKPQKIKISGKRTMSVMLTIKSVYKGKIGHTTCLAEMRP